MDKFDFMNMVQECFDECKTWHDVKVRKQIMINAIENMFKLEMEFRKKEKRLEE